ncbi:MAG TPA: hypothetical protein VFS02_23320 [Telluria sp.]|nr:hypothetical protein [Telluria sp.]
MNKQELSWFMVRLIGVGLVLNGMRYVAIVIENILVMRTGPAGQILMSQSSGLLGGWVAEALISLAVGVYLIKRGDFLFHWLNSEPNP